jgi:ABC-type multidrug transport system ATPase subunit
VITAASVELRAGSRLLLDDATFRVAPGDRVGLVGRNGAGKTTLTKALAGETQPAAGSITTSGQVGYLPQDPRGVDLTVTARDRILSARGLDEIVRKLRESELAMATATGEKQDKAMRRYGRLEGEFVAAGGYAAESEAASIAGALGLDERILGQTLGTLSGGQRRRIELARILFSGAETLLLDEPTNHLDADSIAWLRDHLKGYKGGLVVISHDVGPARRGGQQGLPPRRQPGRARPVQPRLEGLPPAARDRRASAQAGTGQRREEGLGAHGAGRQDARQGDQDRGGPEHGPSSRAAALGSRDRAGPRQGRQAALPQALAVRQDPAAGHRALEVLRLAGDLHRRRPGHRPRLTGRRAGPQRCRQDHPAAHARRRRHPGHRAGRAGPRAEDRLLRPGAREPRRRPVGARQHEVGSARPRRDRRAQGARLVPVQR